MPTAARLLLALAVAWLALWPQASRADVRRCVTASGQTIFTDRKCDEVEAVERLPRSGPATGAQLHRSSCARTLQDLVFEITTAIDGRDANRLAGVYHWPGTSADAGYRIWTQLEAVANRPLVDIIAVMPAASPPPPSEPVADTTGRESTSNDADEAARPAAADPELHPQTTIRRNPVALRVEQTLGNGATPSRTVFGLARHFGCWWVRF